MNQDNLKQLTPSKFVQLKSWNNNRNFSTDTAISLAQSLSEYQKQVELETYRKYKDLFLTIKYNTEDSTERLNKFDEVLKDLEHDSEYISHGYLHEDLIIDTKEYNINNHQIKF